MKALNRARVSQFDRRFRASVQLSSADIGRLYWYARSIDSATAAYWNARTDREAPANSLAIQNRVFGALDRLRSDRDTTTALRTLDDLWRVAPAERRSQVSSYATSIAVASGDTGVIRLWTDRLLTMSAPGSALARAIAMDFVHVPELRAEGLDRLRRLVAQLESPGTDVRALDETREAQRARVDRSLRATYAALGRALVLDGRHRAALDTLALAAAAGWDIDVFRAVRSASLSAGDTSSALAMTARLVVDPRTPAVQADSLSAFGLQRLGSAQWTTLLDLQRKELVRRTLATAQPRHFTHSINVRAMAGSAVDLRSMARGQVTIVAFLSRFCGPAIEALPALQRASTRLALHGVRTISVIDEAAPSPALLDFLRSHDVRLPVFLDDEHLASRAFNQWGTPYFYVLDAEGRVVFGATTDIDEVMLRAEAVRVRGGPA